MNNWRIDNERSPTSVCTINTLEISADGAGSSRAVSLLSSLSLSFARQFMVSCR